MNRSVTLAVIAALIAVGGAYYYWTLPAADAEDAALTAEFNAFPSDMAAVDAAVSDMSADNESF
ncbi:MAG TPA: hypothetical protein VM103_00850 [Candidatus Paceibacterota bacterium]|nr:hypothetical protein [Candidatus Paceibacterota bacterium]